MSFAVLPCFSANRGSSSVSCDWFYSLRLASAKPDLKRCKASQCRVDSEREGHKSCGCEGLWASRAAP
eukprot:1889290-Pleurochrysis_carterae.AAC.1